MPNPLDAPVPQRLGRFAARRRMRLLRVAQLPLQAGKAYVVRTQRRMPLSTGALVAPAESKHVQPCFGVPFQRGKLFGHRGRRLALAPARIGQCTQPAAHPQTAHSREQLPKLRLLRGAAHHARLSPAHRPCSCARVSGHELHWSCG
ncbi:MAG: hypothetical protein QOF46_647 [Paraburkholderia sp.]|nr:hypothetical protein [Paraburkholderia sp.]